MNDERVHCVVVIDEPSDVRSLWGVISDLDLVAAASVRRTDGAGGRRHRDDTRGDDRARRATRARSQSDDEARVAHLVVVDPIEQRPIGVISTLDLAAALAAA